MNTTEYIEYCEDDIKIEIKPEDDDLELSENRKYSEYFEATYMLWLGKGSFNLPP